MQKLDNLNLRYDGVDAAFKQKLSKYKSEFINRQEHIDLAIQNVKKALLSNDLPKLYNRSFDESTKM